MSNNQWKEMESYLIQSRYSLRIGDGDPIESSYHEVINRVIQTVFSPQFSSKCPSYLQEFIGKFESDLSIALFEKKIIPATPALINIGSPAKNKSYFSCFPFGPVPDSLNGILEFTVMAAKVFQAGGGVGIDVSDIRAKGAKCASNQCSASGPTTFMEIFDKVADVVRQGGRRRGAFIATMESRHPDFSEFIRLKVDEKRRNFSNMNLSVVLKKEDLENDKLINYIADTIHKCGDPGIIFIDNVIQETPIPEELRPWYANPCAEYLSVPMTACNLISLNLNEIYNATDGTDSFLETLHDLAGLACLFGNILIHQDEGYPVLGIRHQTQELRPVGVGMMGLHEFLVQINVSYDSQGAPRLAKRIQEAISIGSMRMSAEITLEGEAFPAAKVPCRTDWMIDFVNRHNDTYKESKDIILSALNKRGSLYNIVTTSQPPTGSVSQIVGCFSPGIEPIFSHTLERKIKDEDDNWKIFSLTSPWVDMSKEKTALEISGEQHLKVLKAIQQFCHTGISKTINVAEGIDPKEIAKLIHYAYNNNLKSITIYRDASLSEQILTASEENEEVSQDKFDSLTNEQPKEDVKIEIEIDPKNLGITSRMEAEILARRIHVFPKVFKAEPIDLPSVREGILYALKGVRHCYIHTTKHEGRIVEIFIDTGESGTSLHAANQALGRVLSISLRSNETLKDRFIKTLKGIDSGTIYTLQPVEGGPVKRYKSIPDAISDILTFPISSEKQDFEVKAEDFEKQITTNTIRDECPECGHFSMTRKGGCKICLNCKYEIC